MKARIVRGIMVLTVGMTLWGTGPAAAQATVDAPPRLRLQMPAWLAAVPQASLPDDVGAVERPVPATRPRTRSALTRQRSSDAGRRSCSGGRRTWLGAAVGGGVAIPAGVLLDRRLSNEGADGSAALALTVGTGVALGALIGWGTCR
jgi:hypothetical protein